jgi:hypothetical protein
MQPLIVLLAICASPVLVALLILKIVPAGKVGSAFKWCTPKLMWAGVGVAALTLVAFLLHGTYGLLTSGPLGLITFLLIIIACK